MSNNNSKAWELQDLVLNIETVLKEKKDNIDARLVEGRAQYVVLSPGKGDSEHIVMGLASLPRNFSTPEHTHYSEEIAICVNGSGQVDIEGKIHLIKKDSIVYVPSSLNHVTTSGEDGLTVLWFYSPPGSESKWIQEE
jgi:quercetin dioxygenase-like cupin family protein